MMNIETLHQRINEQIDRAADSFGLSVTRLKFTADIFKPDSPKFETVVSLEIGNRDNKTGYIRNNHYFYSPRKYDFSSVSKLRAEIKDYLKNKKLKNFWSKTPAVVYAAAWSVRLAVRPVKSFPTEATHFGKAAFFDYYPVFIGFMLVSALNFLSM